MLAELAGLKNIEILEETWAESLKKIVVYVPAGYEQAVRDAMCGAGAGHIGAYSHCTFGAAGKGTFLPLEGTKMCIRDRRGRGALLSGALYPSAYLDLCLYRNPWRYRRWLFCEVWLAGSV